MKIAFMSDVHGVPSALATALSAADSLGFDRLVLLGDLLYHGPRNGVPNFYDPVEVAKMLNVRKDRIVAVRGNCDAEVDQMVLEFPILADYALLDLDGTTAFVTHGHLFNSGCLPPHKPGDLLIHGHTHVLTVQQAGSMTYINPGSAALPKEGNPRSYMVYDKGVFEIKTLDGEVVLRHAL